MNSSEILTLVKVLSSVIDLAKSANIDMQRYLAVKARAESEGRDISDEELNEFRAASKLAIEKAAEA